VYRLQLHYRPTAPRILSGLPKAEAKNKSQLFREMFIVYERRRREEQFHELQRYGAKKARKKGVLTEADVEKLVFQGR